MTLDLSQNGVSELRRPAAQNGTLETTLMYLIRSEINATQGQGRRDHRGRKRNR